MYREARVDARVPSSVILIVKTGDNDCMDEDCAVKRWRWGQNLTVGATSEETPSGRKI